MSALKKKTLAARKAIRPKRIRPTRLQIKNRAKKAKFDELLPPGIVESRMQALGKLLKSGSLKVAPPIRESGKSVFHRRRPNDMLIYPGMPGCKITQTPSIPAHAFVAHNKGIPVEGLMPFNELVAGMTPMGTPLKPVIFNETTVMDEDEAAIHDIYKESLIDYQLELACEGCGQSIFFAFVMTSKIENNMQVMSKGQFKQSILDNLALSDQEMRHVKQETGVGCYFCGRYIFKRVWQCVEGIE